MIDEAAITKIDASNMREVLINFPRQIEEAAEIGEKAPKFKGEKFDSLLVLGMGGSAIAGDALFSYMSLSGKFKKKVVWVNRDYFIRYPVTKKTLVVASSYSGNTEETLAAYKSALKLAKNIVCLTTGGELAKLAERNGSPIIELPKGFQPRAAFGFSFISLLVLALKNGFAKKGKKKEIKDEIKRLVDFLDKRSEEYSKIDKNNEAIRWAEEAKDLIPVVYASETLYSAALRLARQIQENAKRLAFSGALPETNHNEINAWKNPAGLAKKFALFALRDKSEFDRIRLRFEAIKTLIGPKTAKIFEKFAEGDSELERLFDLIYFGDWVSYYLAVADGEDPTPIPVIGELKRIMANAR